VRAHLVAIVHAERPDVDDFTRPASFLPSSAGLSGLHLISCRGFSFQLEANNLAGCKAVQANSLQVLGQAYAGHNRFVTCPRAGVRGYRASADYFRGGYSDARKRRPDALGKTHSTEVYEPARI
jgi:hypothetical protein